MELKQRLHGWAGLALVMAAMVGCASGPLKESDGNQVVSILPGRGEIKLEHPARVGIEQPLAEPCSGKAISDLRFTVTQAGRPVSYQSFCDPKQRLITLLTKEVLKPGLVQVRLDRKGALSRFSSYPTMIIEFQSADFASAEDQSPAGAAALAENQQVKGVVNYNSGDQTDWIRIEGEQGTMNVTVFSESRVPPDVHLVAIDQESGEPVGLGPFVIGQDRRIVLSGRAAYVRVRAKRAPGEAQYLVVRRDLVKGNSQMVDVIDLYPISALSSVVVLEGRDDIKEGTQVHVVGMNLAGKPESLGRCVIKSAGKDQASCMLGAVPKPTMVSFKARYAKGS